MEEAAGTGALVGIMLAMLANGETVIFFSLLIPTIYFNYRFFNRLYKEAKNKKYE
jgi:hypothetical protein